jgi:hypothetical protein
MNERFGYERTSAFFLQPFSAASGLFGPIERNEIISREVKNETRVHLKLKRTVWSGAYVNPVEVVESVAKEDGEWRIDTNADSLKATDAQKNWIVHQVTDIELL